MPLVLVNKKQFNEPLNNLSSAISLSVNKINVRLILTIFTIISVFIPA